MSIDMGQIIWYKKWVERLEETYKEQFSNGK
jgi:hypothetical protein